MSYRNVREQGETIATLATLDQLEKETGLNEKFLTISLVCGPPTPAFVWEFKTSDAFQRCARELFPWIRTTLDFRTLYNTYEKWYEQQDLERIIREGPPPKKTTDP